MKFLTVNRHSATGQAQPLIYKEVTDYAWRVELAPKVIWYREEGQQPNAFHRMMQRLFFGFKWEKLDYEGSETHD